MITILSIIVLIAAVLWYRESGIEFGRYGEEEGGREEYHYEHEILYIIVDGHKYILNDNVNEPDALYLF